MLEAAAIGDMPQRSMDNPYQPPTAPLVAGTTDGPVDRSVTIDSRKGPVRFERHGEAISLVFGTIKKDIPAAKFVQNIFLHFTRTKRVSLHPIRQYLVAIPEEKFHALLNFYGIERFKLHDIRSLRMIHAILALPLPLYAVQNMPRIVSALNDWSISLLLFMLPFLASTAVSMVLFALTFSRFYRTYWCLTAFSAILFSVLFVGLWYSNGRWWMLGLLFPSLWVLAMSWGRVRYFAKQRT